MDILGKARAQQSLLERIANRIPGFKGYREKELRREADRVGREYLARQLEECVRSLDGWASDASRSGSLDAINDIETARKRLDKVVARIRFADRGYAGFFDAVKVDEDALRRLYEFDESLLADVEAIREARTFSSDALRAMIERIDSLDAKLGERENLLAGIR